VGNLENSWTRLIGQQPTDQDKQELYRVRDAINLKPTDAVWDLVIAFQYYKKLYEQFPARIADAAREVTQGVRAAAEAEAKAAQAATKRALFEAVREAAVKSARYTAGASLAKWVSIAVVGVLIFGWAAFFQGQAKGRAVGENLARRECAALVAASSWANTPDGQLAFSLAKAGGLADVGRCSGRGMVPRDGWCTVPSERGKALARWPLPPSGGSSR
jgi:hypothetical protein